MIFDSIKNKDNYKYNKNIYAALNFLSSLKDGELPNTNTILIPNQLFCNPVHLTSKPEEECIYEAHRKYIDLHYIVEGVEKIATSDISKLTSTQDYSQDNDIEFLTGQADGYYILNPKNFMVCFPNDAHKVAIMNNCASKISKIVFKIAMEDSDCEIK